MNDLLCREFNVRQSPPSSNANLIRVQHFKTGGEEVIFTPQASLGVCCCPPRCHVAVLCVVVRPVICRTTWSAANFAHTRLQNHNLLGLGL